MSTGNRIMARRKQLGLSREALAQMLGKTRMTVWRVETGTTQIPADKLPMWAKALKTSPQRLVP